MKTANDTVLTGNERAAEVARWYLELRKTANTHFLPLFFDTHRFLVLCGGGGSGKSVFAGRKVLERCATEPGHRFLVVRKVAETLKESCYRQLCAQADELYPEAVSAKLKTPMRILFHNGSEILFSGLDDVEKLKSIYHITSIWIEEGSEISEGDLNQLDIRLRDECDYYKQIMITFNPISALHWLKKRFFDRTDPDVRTDRSTYKDNRFLTQEAINTLLRFRETDPYYFMVYALGEWGITGRTVFDRGLIAQRLEQKIQLCAVGFFSFSYDGLEIEDIGFQEERDGAVSVYKRPEKGHPYVIGADTAGDGSDCFVGHVLDNYTGEQVALLRMRTDEDLFAHQLFCLGMYYNTALIGIETNFSIYPVLELERLNYPLQYVREVMDDFNHGIRQAFGFRTDLKTRPVIIANLIKEFRSHPECVCDETTLSEMSTFVRNEMMRAEAEPGAHDDCVMAAAIAQFIRPSMRYTIERDETRTHWTEDMWEDFDNASAKERKELLRLYGKPDAER